ncbi:MAG: sulfatase-like hydrolase/transferase [Kiritimatiellaeota bacterium]|nr:sulfatase-like hydrolase/transferase [Kiritimatiellota bacterium]
MNAIAIVLDTFRADIIGAAGKLNFVETPNLDALARESIVFERAFGEGQPTLQVRRAFFTGRRSFPFVYNFDRRGHWHHQPGWHKIPPEQDTLAEVLSARGYCTGLVADVYHMFKPTMNYWRGFTTYEFLRGQESDNWKCGAPELVAEAMKRYTRDPEDLVRNAVLYQYLQNQRFRQGEEDYQCARVFRTAMDWLGENAANKPFLLWIEAFDPHEPWDPPRRFADRYCPGYSGIDFIMPRLGPNPTAAEIERTRALYFGEVTFVDFWVGRLLDKARELGLLEDTVVLVLSDHGTQVWDHGGFGKGGGNMRAYNTGIVWQMRVPGRPGRRVPAFVQSHDVMPTLLDLLGISYDRTDGVSAMPLVREEAERIRDDVVIGWAVQPTGTPNAAAFASVRTDRWNYVTPVHRTEAPEVLFDLRNDPEENENVADAHPDVVCELRRRVEAVVGQPLPARLNEVCDPAPPPMVEYLHRRPHPKSG